MRKFVTLILIACACLVQACDVHELPEGGVGIRLSLVLQYPGDMPDYRTVSLTKAGAALTSRYTVQVFRYDADGVLLAEPVWSEEFRGEQITRLDTTLALTLPRERYRVIAWTDYLADGQPFYEPSDFMGIQLSGAYAGCEEARDAFTGSLELDLRSTESYDKTILEEVVEMTRLLARVDFFLADRDSFREKAGTDDLSLWRVVFSYPAFLPDSYNLFGGHTVTAREGVQFEGRMEEAADGSIRLGYDYLFVNGDVSEVIMALTIYDPSGQACGSLPATNIPIARGKRTLVRGDFFTGSGGGGIAIDPGFDGDINIHL